LQTMRGIKAVSYNTMPKPRFSGAGINKIWGDPMKLSDLFLPRIARSDPEVRKKAVLKETNVGLLKQVSEKDEDPDVRELALKRLQAL
jgi:hypothetical protein